VELRARLEELRGSRIRILQAEQNERRRLERDLHDGAQQRLVALSLELGKLGFQLAEDPELRARVDAAGSEVAATLTELRDLAHGLHPAAVSDHGLAVALESLATHATVPVQVIGAPVVRLPEPVELAAFYLVCEGLANVAKHARASSAVVELTREPTNLVIEITDDGRGGATTEHGAGLRGLADRVEALGGRLQVWSPLGQGTRVRAEIPCGQ
jgi:signal transduction histidine kinase